MFIDTDIPPIPSSRKRIESQITETLPQINSPQFKSSEILFSPNKQQNEHLNSLYNSLEGTLIEDTPVYKLTAIAERIDQATGITIQKRKPYSVHYKNNSELNSPQDLFQNSFQTNEKDFVQENQNSRKESSFNNRFNAASACGFFGIAKFEHKYFKGYETWLDQEQLLQRTIKEQYLYSYFWASCLMIQSLVFMPKTNAEVLFTTVVMFFTCIIIAYIINTIGNILHEMQKQTEQYDNDIETINAYMNRKKITLDLQYKIRNFLEHIYFEEKAVTSQKEEIVLNKISKNLQEEIYKEVNIEILNKIQVLKANFSETTLNKITLLLEEITLSSQEILAPFDCNQDLFYLYKGQLEFLHSQNLQQIQTIEEGSSLNEFAFFTGQIETQFCARSIGFSTVYRISRSDFLKCLEDEEMQKFFVLRDELTFNTQNRNDSYQVLCPICNEYSHQASECNQIKYIPDKFQIIKQFNVNHPQERANHTERKRNKKQKSLTIMHLVKSAYENHRQYINLLYSQIEWKKDFIDEEDYSQMISSQDSNCSSSMNICNANPESDAIIQQEQTDVQENLHGFNPRQGIKKQTYLSNVNEHSIEDDDELQLSQNFQNIFNKQRRHQHKSNNNIDARENVFSEAIKIPQRKTSILQFESSHMMSSNGNPLNNIKSLSPKNLNSRNFSSQIRNRTISQKKNLNHLPKLQLSRAQSQNYNPNDLLQSYIFPYFSPQQQQQWYQSQQQQYKHMNSLFLNTPSHLNSNTYSSGMQSNFISQNSRQSAANQSNQLINSSIQQKSSHQSQQQQSYAINLHKLKQSTQLLLENEKEQPHQSTINQYEQDMDDLNKIQEQIQYILNQQQNSVVQNFDHLFIYNFDKVQKFSIYYPQYNMRNVVYNYQKYQKLKEKKNQQLIRQSLACKKQLMVFNSIKAQLDSSIIEKQNPPQLSHFSPQINSKRQIQ